MSQLILISFKITGRKIETIIVKVHTPITSLLKPRRLSIDCIVLCCNKVPSAASFV